MVDTNKIVVNKEHLLSENAIKLIERFNKHNSKNKKQIYWIDYIFEKELSTEEIIVKVIKKDKKQPIKFLAYYYKCGIDEKNHYYQLLVNPTLGKFKWCIDHYEENNYDEISISVSLQESVFTPEVLDEIMHYMTSSLKGVIDVCIVTYLHVEKMIFTETEYKQLINDGHCSNRYEIPIVLI